MKTKTFLSLVAGAALPLAASAQTVDTIVNSGLLEPHSIAFGSDTTFYVSDSASHRVYQFDSKNGVLTTLAGVNGQSGTDNGPGFLARFLSPRGLATARGGLIVADAGNHTLRFLTLTGSVSVVTTFAGSPTVPGFVDGPLASARFNTPAGLATDNAGNIYIADSKNNAIRKIDAANNVTTISASFFEPSALVFDNTNKLFVADTRNHAIKIIDLTSGSVIHFAGSTNKVAGTNDSFFAEEALFNQPSGLVWLSGTTGLLVSDTGNHTVRRIYYDPIVAGFFPALSGYSVETYAGTPRQLGLLDGALKAAKFNSPVGMTKDPDGGLIIADLGNRALRRIQTTPKLPKVSDPKIGYVIFVEDEKTGEIVSKLIPFSEAVFNNDPIIAVLGEAGTDAIYTFGPTPALFEPDTIPAPSVLSSLPAPPYADGSPISAVRPSILSPDPDITVKVVSTVDGRRPSEVVKARVQFKTAPVTIVGDNPASFQVASVTTGAEIWYTLDGSIPTNRPPSLEASISTISVITNASFMFRARAFRPDFKPSDVTTKNFSPTDFKANRITFGFERGEASSDFVASPGQRFYAPVTLSLLPTAKMYSLQFNVTVTNQPGSPAVAPGAVGFRSMLQERLPTTPPSYRTIPPAMLATSTNPAPLSSVFVRDGLPFTDLRFTNANINLIGVGWLERFTFTNLFNTVGQDLITYSIAHDTIFLSSANKVVTGAYSFDVPTTAANGHAYEIRIGRASATSDGIGGPNGDLYLDMPTAGSLGAGPINSVKSVTVGQRKYVVGDVAPFRWLNAGDFGNTNVINDDVMQVFQSAVYLVNFPIPGSDFFDAMDSCCRDAVPSAGGHVLPGPNTLVGAAENPFFNGTEATINNIAFGDGNLDAADVFVTFRRALDPSLTWYRRFWTNGVLAAEVTPNLFRGKPFSPPEIISSAAAQLDESSNEPPSIFFSVPDLAVVGGDMVSIPLSAQIHGKYPARIALMNVQVEPLDGTAPLVESVEFTPNPNLGQPTLNTSQGVNNYAAAWLNDTAPGLRSSTQLGTLRVKLPANLPANAAYRVRFEHVSASPNGLGVFPQSVQDGLLLASPRNESCYNDGIPDSWRLRYFGSVSNLLSHADADADGDGVPNKVEFKTGTNPTDLRSHLRVSTRANASARALVLRWPTAQGKRYTIEAASSVASEEWTPISPNVIGTGVEMEFTPPDNGPSMQFYRVRLIE